jgi:hypothetical protein
MGKREVLLQFYFGIRNFLLSKVSESFKKNFFVMVPIKVAHCKTNKIELWDALYNKQYIYVCTPNGMVRN